MIEIDAETEANVRAHLKGWTEIEIRTWVRQAIESKLLHEQQEEKTGDVPDVLF